MAARTCPKCNAVIAAAEAAAFSDGVECPNCQTRLAVSEGSRMIATWIGLVAGYLVWRLSLNAGGPLGWALPTLYSFLAFSFVSALGVMFAADLRIAPPVSTPDTSHAATTGHGAHH